MDTISNRELAAALGLHYSFVSRLRRGLRIPGRETMLKVADYYELDEQDLAEWGMAIHRGGPEGSRQWLSNKLGW